MDPSQLPVDHRCDRTGGQGHRHADHERRQPAERGLPAYRPDDALRRVHGRHHPPLLPDVAAGGLLGPERDARQPERLRERPVPVRRHLVLHRRQRRGQLDGLHERPARRHAVLQDAGRQLRHERQHAPVGDGWHRCQPLAGGFRRRRGLDRRRRKSGRASRRADRGSAPARRHQQPLHARRKFQQLLRSRSGRRGPHRQLSGLIASPPQLELRGQHLLLPEQHEPCVRPRRHAQDDRHVRAADHPALDW